MLPTKARNITPESTHICILFDPADGRVFHTHRVITLPGGKKLTPEQVEQRTLHLAEKLHIDASKLSLLHVPPEQYKASVAYKVDPQSRSLVELPAPKPLRDYFGPGRTVIK